MFGALYLFAIARLSPHPLPGLPALALTVFLAGAAAVSSWWSTSLWRVFDQAPRRWLRHDEVASSDRD
jgi:hypothetical protein